MKNNKNNIETEKNLQVAKFISLAIGLQGLFMSILNLIDSNISLVTISLFYGISMLVIFVILHFKQKLFIFYLGLVPIAIYLEVNFIINGGTEGFGVIWMIIAPLFTLYIMSGLWFYISNSLILFILIAFFWTPLSQYIYPFKQTFMVRFPLVYIFSYLFSVFLKYRINKTEKELENQKNILAREIQQAALIQKAFLSQNKEPSDGWELSFDNSPLAGVSGDFYDVFKTQNKLDGIGLFDISGHGISSGLITMLIKNIIRHEFYENSKDELQNIVQKINDRYILEKGNIENYLTGIIVRLNNDSVELVNAGHQLPILYHKKTDKFEIVEKRPLAVGAIGLTNFPSVYESQSFTMEHGDELIIYTDGITETKNKDGISFGKQNLVKILKSYIHFPLEEQISQTLYAATSYAENSEPSDDMSIVILKRV